MPTGGRCQTMEPGPGGEYPGDVRVDLERVEQGDVEIPDHGPRDVVGPCAGTDEETCDEIVVIDRSSLGFISSAAGLREGEALLCDYHLNETLDGLTLDLSIGTEHTRSQEFEDRREQRSVMTDAVEAEAKQEATLEFYDTGEHSQFGKKAYVRMPTAAKSAIEQCEWEDCHQKAHAQRSASDTDLDNWMVYSVDLAAVDTVAAVLDSEGWTVDIDPEVLSAARQAAAQAAADDGE